jgi:hypothetical protein
MARKAAVIAGTPRRERDLVVELGRGRTGTIAAWTIDAFLLIAGRLLSGRQNQPILGRPEQCLGPWLRGQYRRPRAAGPSWLRSVIPAPPITLDRRRAPRYASPAGSKGRAASWKLAGCGVRAGSQPSVRPRPGKRGARRSRTCSGWHPTTRRGRLCRVGIALGSVPRRALINSPKALPSAVPAVGKDDAGARTALPSPHGLIRRPSAHGDGGASTMRSMEPRILVGTQSGLRDVGIGDRPLRDAFVGRPITALTRDLSGVWALVDGREVWAENGERWHKHASVEGPAATCLAPGTSGLIGTEGAHTTAPLGVPPGRRDAAAVSRSGPERGVATARSGVGPSPAPISSRGRRRRRGPGRPAQ